MHTFCEMEIKIFHKMHTRLIIIFATLHPMLKVIVPKKDKNCVDNPFKLNVKKIFKKIT